MIAEEAMTLAAADGAAIEARLARPAGAATGIVIAHPHPLYGGDMDNPVVVRVAEVCAELGLATLRFNFRGVGGSTGRHDDGRAEQLDMEAALAAVRAVVAEPAGVVLAGYSFGSVVAAKVALRDRGLGGLLLIGPPVAVAGTTAFQALRDVGAPLLIVAGGEDQYCSGEALDHLRRDLPAAAIRVIDGANHFFFGKLYPFGETVRTWVDGLRTGAAGAASPSQPTE